MILRLRKRHLVTWFVIAVFLPVLLVVIILKLPNQKYQAVTFTSIEIISGPVLMSGSSNLLNAEIRAFPDNGYQLKLTVLEPLNYPGVVAYLGSDKEHPKKNFLLGRVTNRGHYLFEISDIEKNTFLSVMLYDMIQKVIIETITLE